MLTLYKPTYFQNLGEPTEIPNHFYNALFLIYIHISVYIVWYINIRIGVEYYDRNLP